MGRDRIDSASWKEKPPASDCGGRPAELTLGCTRLRCHPIRLPHTSWSFPRSPMPEITDHSLEWSWRRLAESRMAAMRMHGAQTRTDQLMSST